MESLSLLILKPLFQASTISDSQKNSCMVYINNVKERFLPETFMYLRPKSGFPGLYLTRKKTIHNGFAPSLDAGLYTAGAILNRMMVNDLAAVSEEVQ